MWRVFINKLQIAMKIRGVCCTGYSLLEVIISLVILSTTILLTASFGLQQIQQSRQALVFNQLYMQVDSLAILLGQNSQAHAMIFHQWQTEFHRCFPQATLQCTHSETNFNLIITLFPYCLKVTILSNGALSHKTLTRIDVS